MSEIRCTMPVENRWGVGHGDTVYHLVLTSTLPGQSLGGWLFEAFLRAQARAGLEPPPQAPSAIPETVLRQRISPFKPHLVLCRSAATAEAGRMQFGARAALFSLKDVQSLTLVIGSQYSVGFDFRGVPAELATLPAPATDDVTLDLLRAVIEIAGFFELRFEYVERRSG